MYEFIYYKAGDAMTRKVIAVAPDTTLAAADAVFGECGFNGLPVVGSDGRLVGFLTKLDLLRAFKFTPDAVTPHYDEIMCRPVETVMTRGPNTVSPETPLTHVLEELLRAGVKSMPVVDGERLVGIVAREDVLRALRRAASGERPPE